MMKTALLLIQCLSVCNITVVKATFSTTTWYEAIHGYEAMPNKKEICNTLWYDWPADADYQMDPQETPNINWFDMSPNNMNLVLNDALGAGVHATYSNWYEAPDNLNWGNPGSGSANQKSWTEMTTAYNVNKSAFILHGKRVGSVSTSSGSNTSTNTGSTDNNMINGWPDALECDQGWSIGQSSVYYLDSVLADTTWYRSIDDSNKQLMFNADKSWKSGQSSSWFQYSCFEKSIQTLISEGNAKNFVSSESSTSMVQSRPDAITCGNGVIFWGSELSTTSQSIYRNIVRSTNHNTDNYVIFNGDADGTFNSRNTNLSGSEGCNGKSLQDLYNESKAFNFVSNIPSTIIGTNDNGQINNWPNAINCPTDANTEIIYQIRFSSQNNYEDHEVYYFNMNTLDKKFLGFRNDGEYFMSFGNHVTLCEGETISQIAAAGRAFYWTKSKLGDNNQYSVTQSGNTGYTKNSAVHMVVWLIEKSRVAFRDKNLQLKDFFITYLPTGDITQIICSGRYKYGEIGWSVARPTFEINEPFDNFLERADELSDQEDRYFHGKNCPVIPPVVPMIPEDMPCTWALRQGKFFADGRIHNEINSVGGLHQCIQRIYGKRTHTLDCFYNGLVDSTHKSMSDIEELRGTGEYTDAEIDAMVASHSDAQTQEKDHCAAYEKMNALASDHTYRCKCQDNIKPSNHLGDGNAELTWEWSNSTDDFLASSKANSYRCSEMKSWEDSHCLSWSKNADLTDTYPDGQCEACRNMGTDMYLRLDNKCIRWTTEIDSRTFPSNCYSGKEVTIGDENIIQCHICSPGFYMDNYGAGTPTLCEANSPGNLGVRVEHCDLAMMQNYVYHHRCYQCDSTHLLQKALDSETNDSCVSSIFTTTDFFASQYTTDDDDHFTHDYAGCQFTTATITTHTGLSVDNLPACNKCKVGYEQIRKDNKRCQSIETENFTNTNEIELAKRHNEMALAN